MKKKDKVISARVQTEVADILDIMCEIQGLTKNKVVSDLITEKYNRDKHLHKLSPLQMVLWKIEDIVDSQYNEYTKETTPCILVADEEIDGEYLGKLQILVGDDTCIREQDGKFYVYDFHDTDAEPLLLNDKEIVDFYKGQYDAYGVPSLRDESYHYMRGYHQVMSSLADIIESELIEHENLHKNI
jgi:hypothetical protein